MSKAFKSTQCEQCIKQVPPEKSDQGETSSDQEVFFNLQPSTSTHDAKYEYVYAIHRGANCGLDS